jgi:hypothetical protein
MGRSLAFGEKSPESLPGCLPSGRLLAVFFAKKLGPAAWTRFFCKLPHAALKGSERKVFLLFVASMERKQKADRFSMQN